MSPPTFEEAWKLRALAGNCEAVDQLVAAVLTPLSRWLADGEWPADQTVQKQQAAKRLSADTKVTQLAP